MFVMVTHTYPLDKATEVGKAFTKLPPRSPFIKRVGLYSILSTELGVKNYGLYEIEDEKLAEGLREMTKRLLNYKDVVGFGFKIEPLLTPEEALPFLGLAPP